MKHLAAFTMAGLLACAAAEARTDEVSVLLGNDYGEVAYSRHDTFMGIEGADVTAGLLMTEVNNILAHGTLSIPVLEEKTPLDISVGTRLFLASLVEPDDDIMGVGFGASASWRLPTDGVPFLRRFPLTLASSIYFSPEITTSGSGVDVTDLHVIRGEFELTPNMDALVGLRTLNVDRDAGEEDIVDERLYVGLRVRF
jgi:hypothetical protein